MDTTEYNGFIQQSKLNEHFLIRVVVLAVFTVYGCGTSTEMREGGNTTSEMMALGVVDRAVFERLEYHEFKATYDTVTIKQEFVDIIRDAVTGIDVTVFFGTWCSDSRREVPRFLKVADLAGFPPERIAFYGLDRSKKSQDGLTEKYHIERVPTIIFFRNGSEVGRITETPRTTMEADMLSILAEGRSY